jgi:hypothetical protein
MEISKNQESQSNQLQGTIHPSQHGKEVPSALIQQEVNSEIIHPFLVMVFASLCLCCL